MCDHKCNFNNLHNEYIQKLKDEKSKSQSYEAKFAQPMDVDNIFGQFYQRVIDPDKKLKLGYREFDPPAPRPKEAAKANAEPLVVDKEKLPKGMFMVL